MKSLIKNRYITTIFAAVSLVMVSGCERELFDLDPAKFPSTAEVFIDTFSPGLEYLAFGDSKLTAFDVDTDVKYEGTASMRFDIPNVGDPEGAYAGGIFRDPGGRDLSGYNALTFWAKGSQAGTVDLTGFGQDFGENKYTTSLNSLSLSTAWTKYIIPIPDPDKLTQEKGMFVFAEGPEDGKGYTVWIDELKFEKIATIAQPRPSIQSGNDEIEQTYIGVSTSVSGLSFTVNLPSGVDQTVSAAPSYFEFSSTNPAVATVDEDGEVSIVGAGSTKITATLGGVEADGSLTIVSLGEFVAAPTPTEDPENVISIFSDAYENVPVDFYNGYFAPFQTTQGQNDITINGDNLIKYTQLNFVATEFKNPTVNATEMTHFHTDILIDESINPGDFIRIQLGDFGADGAFDGGDDSNGSVTISSAELTSGSWISLDLPLSSFGGLTSRANLAQIFFISDATISTILVDNMYFYKGDGGGGPDEPTTAAPAPPTREAANVVSIFSDAYTNISNVNLNPDWGQATQVSQVDVAGNNTLKYANLNYQGTDFDANEQDLSGMEFLHIDMWTANATDVKMTPINRSGSPTEFLVGLTPINAGQWNSYDIPLTDFTSSGMTLDQVFQLKFDGQGGTQGTIWLDNIYFYKEATTATEPTTAAPAPPTRDAADVVSIFSDAYTNITNVNLNPDWGQATQVSEVDVAGNNTLKYANLNYQGTDFDANQQDLSGMEFLHIDMWTADATDVKMTPINRSGSPTEFLVGLTPINAGQWNSYDIPLTDFTSSGMTLDQVFQLKFDGQGGTQGTIWLDNIYFYKEATAATEPTTAAPAPPARDAADVVSIFSDAYTNITNVNLNPDWGQATQVSEVDVAGNNTLKYANLNYQGTDFDANEQDLSGMEFLHIDMWTADATDVKMTPINRSGAPTEFLVGLTPINAGQWNSYDIPLTDFTSSGMTLDQVFQLKFDGQGGTQGTIWLDNIYFYREPLATEPTTAAPAPPTRDAADVVSIFSDAYTDITGVDYNPNWGQATQVTQVDIAGNNTLKYASLNYQGTDFSGNAQDVSGMEFLHIDMWTADATDVKMTPIDTDDTPTELLVSLAITPGQWVSYDIPLSDFTGMTLDNVTQLKFDGQGGTQGTIWLDNIYFYKSGAGGCVQVGNELTLNGGFETGDTSCWTSFATENNGSFEATSAQSNGGSFSGLIIADVDGIGSPSFPVVKQANIGIGTVTPNTSVTITFDLYGSVAGVGGVVFAEFFSELSEGGTSKAEILGGGPLFPSSTWTTYTFTTTTGTDVSGGVTLQLKADCGGNSGCRIDAYIDNVSVTIN